MSLTFNLIFQFLGLVVQYGVAATDWAPAKYRPFIHLAVGIAQAVLAWRQAYYNPNGTPASAPYKP